MNKKLSRIIFYNAHIFSSDPSLLGSDTVAIENDLISWIGNLKELNTSDWKDSEYINCNHNSLLPGFIDSHIHFLAFATNLSAINCGPEVVNSIEELKIHLKNHQSEAHWIKGFGYDESSLLEMRHPNRYDLDEHFPDNPVSIKHRSGHARVLNSKALSMTGIDASSVDPPAGVIQRDSTGLPTGVLFEMDGYLDSKIPHVESSELHQMIREGNEKLLSYGITTIHDCTAENSLNRLKIFEDRAEYLADRRVRVVFMPGSNHFHHFFNRSYSDDFLSIGQVKIMQTDTTGIHVPDLNEMINLIKSAHESNFSVAIHAVSNDSVAQAAIAISESGPNTIGFPPDRIEHSSECPADNVALILKSKAHVISNPAFLYTHGDKYLEQISSLDLKTLYPFKSILDSGIPLAFGSDAPVTDPNPLTGIYAAVSRLTNSAQEINASQALEIDTAISAYTKNGAIAGNPRFKIGSISTQNKADLILLNHNISEIPVQNILDLNVELTLLNGEIVWTSS